MKHFRGQVREYQLNMKNLKSVQSVLIMSLIFTELSAQANVDKWVNISNTPKCAADMGKPADSIFVTASLRNTGIVLNNLAKQTGKDQTTFVGEGLRFYKVKLNVLSKEIIDGLNSSALPFVTTESEAATNWKELDRSAQTRNHFAQSTCTQVNEINAYYSHLFLRGVNQETLTKLAEKLSEKNSSTDCESANIKADLDLYPVYNYDLKIKDENKWQANGYKFWASFKIYLSWAWRHSKNEMIAKNPMNKMTLVNPMEEQILLLSNGCKSIERPECNSDFLSAAELRNLFTKDRSKLTMTSSTLEMKDLISDNNDQIDSRIKQNIARDSGDQTWIKEFQKSYTGFSTKMIEDLYAANKIFTTVSSQKTLAVYKNEFLTEMAKPENFEEAHYLCVEHRLINRNDSYNYFKFDLKNLKTNGHYLDQFLKYGMSVTDIMNSYENIANEVTTACDNLDREQTKVADSKWNNYRPWYRDYLSRYKSIQNEIVREKQESDEKAFVDNRPLSYLKDQCASAIDCQRRMVESVISINKLLLHSKTYLRMAIPSAPIFNERAEKVACGSYDPFEPARLNKKKLWADMISSVLFGWTGLPIYLDVNFQKKDLIGFDKLIEDGKVTFDPQYGEIRMTKTYALNLGSFINVPCSISLTETNINPNETMNGSLYKGLAINTCSGVKNERLTSPTGSIDVFKKAPEGDFQTCGSCALNFENAIKFAAVNVFAPIRVLVRGLQAIIRYNEVKNDDSINPTEFNINTKELLKTYKKHRIIPAECVTMLSHGLSCERNICEALAVKEFELRTGMEVETIMMMKDYERNTYESAYIQVVGGKKESRFTVQCSESGDTFWMPITNGEIKQLGKE